MTRPYQQHGLHTLKHRLKVRGLAGIDMRSAAARALVAWRTELEADLGGAAAISAQQRAVVDLASTTKLLLDSIDRYLLEQDGLVNRKRRAVYPVVLQRQQLADGLARYMAQLGLERRKPAAPSLESYIAARYSRADEIPQSSQDQRSAARAEEEPDQTAAVEHSASAEPTLAPDIPLREHPASGARATDLTDEEPTHA